MTSGSTLRSCLGGEGAGSHSPSTQIPSPPKETRKYIGKYSLYWSSETTNQKYNFAFKNLPSQDEYTTIDNIQPSPPFPLGSPQIWFQLANQKKEDCGPTLGRAFSWGSLCTPFGGEWSSQRPFCPPPTLLPHYALL